MDPGLLPVLAAGASLVPAWLWLSRPVRLASRFRFVERFEVCPGIRHVGTTLTAGVGVAELAAPFACPVLDNLVIAVPHRCGVGLAAHFFPRQLISHRWLALAQESQRAVETTRPALSGRQIEALAQGERKHPAMSRVMEVFA